MRKVRGKTAKLTGNGTRPGWESNMTKVWLASSELTATYSSLGRGKEVDQTIKCIHFSN